MSIENAKKDANVESLRERCLQPGLYSKYLKYWLKEFPIEQFYFIDGDDFKVNPFTYLNDIQGFVGLPQPHIKFENHLVLSKKKGFYCQLNANKTEKCLGISKGRTYAPMDDESKIFLKSYYKKPNEDLRKLLSSFNLNYPIWL